MGKPSWFCILASLGLLCWLLPACERAPVSPQTVPSDPGSEEPLPQGESSYPRRAFCHAYFADQADSLLWRCDLLYGHSETHEVLAMKVRAAAAGQEEWLGRVRIVQVFCPLTTRCRWMAEGLPRYVEDHWRENPDYAIDKAVYENFQENCNWFLCDTGGTPLPLWGEEHHLLNLSPACPRGVWGSTAGLTFVEWMCSDDFLDVFLASRWADAFDGMQVEDGPPRCGVPCWRWDRGDAFIDPDGPAEQGLPPETCAQFQDRAGPHFDLWLRGCIGELTRRGVLTRCNGHWTGLHPEKQNYPLIGECFASCKLEKFGDWSGWPYDDLDQWANVYFALEEVYHAGEDRLAGGASRTDGVVISDGTSVSREPIPLGWDGATCQITPERDWPLERILQWERALGALCVMGEATFSLTWRDDPLQWQRSKPVPEAPELAIPLGDALDPAQRWANGWFRWFAHGADTCTVISDLQAEDGIWLEGRHDPGDELR